jgi:hypothetical protein
MRHPFCVNVISIGVMGVESTIQQLIIRSVTNIYHEIGSWVVSFSRTLINFVRLKRRDKARTATHLICWDMSDIVIWAG